MENRNNLTYAEAMKELEGIVGQIENEDIPVDELLKKVNRSSELIRFCQDKLTQTEQEVSKVLDKMKEDTGEKAKPESESSSPEEHPEASADEGDSDDAPF